MLGGGLVYGDPEMVFTVGAAEFIASDLVVIRMELMGWHRRGI